MILDIGCGTGRHVTAAMRFPKAMVVGADINIDEAVAAKNRLNTDQKFRSHGDGKGEIMVADICGLPFRDNFFDIVVCSEVLEHIQHHKTAISEIARVLKPGKDLVVSVPRYLPERICWMLSKDYRNSHNGHIRIYSKNQLIDLLKNSGLVKWGLHFAHSLHTPYWWLKCFVGVDRQNSKLVNQYHRFLVWDMMKKPWITQLLEKLLNPVLGKSVVLYLKKEIK